jgi:hypothetical protein
MTKFCPNAIAYNHIPPPRLHQIFCEHEQRLYVKAGKINRRKALTEGLLVLKRKNEVMAHARKIRHPLATYYVKTFRPRKVESNKIQ